MDSLRWFKKVKTAVEANKAVLEILGVHGVTSLHTVSHYFYFPQESDAQACADYLNQEEFEAETQFSAYGKNWLVLARHQCVSTEATIDRMYKEFKNLAKKWNGEYDGWEVEIKSH